MQREAANQPASTLLNQSSDMKNTAIILIVFVIAFLAGMFMQKEMGLAGPKRTIYGVTNEQVQQYRQHAYRTGFYYGAALTLQGAITDRDSTYEYWLSQKTEEYMNPTGR